MKKTKTKTIRQVIRKLLYEGTSVEKIKKELEKLQITYTDYTILNYCWIYCFKFVFCKKNNVQWTIIYFFVFKLYIKSNEKKIIKESIFNIFTYLF